MEIKMKRFNKVALVPAAVAAVLAGNAYAGTEACFEIYDTTDAAAVDHIKAFETRYTGATCIVESKRGGASASDLEPTKESKVAYELTGDLALDFDNVNLSAAPATERDIQIVYVPTTNIPSSSRLVFKLDGAIFHGNANKIHLVKDKDGEADATGADDGFEAVADADGVFDGSNTLTFLTKDIEIRAGTRLVLSRSENADTTTAATLKPISIKIENDVCTSTTSTKSVTLKVTSATTDGGGSITGATSVAHKLVDISPQFYALQDSESTEVKVNAESEDYANQAIVARTEFVYEKGTSTVNKTQAIYPAGFYDRATLLDRAITLSTDDHLETSFVSSGAPGASVQYGIYDTRTAASGVVTSVADEIAVETGTAKGVITVGDATKKVYDTEATDLFVNGAEANPAAATDPRFGAQYNQAFYTVETKDSTKIMNFNYEVTTNYKLNFADDKYLDHCDMKPVTHKVGVNGAVLKVPYTVNAEGNFVRVTNEHDKSAEVTVDVFGESADGTEGKRRVLAVDLGMVPAQSSVVYFVPDVIAQAETQKGYTGADGGYAAKSLGDNASNAVSSNARHTLTFTVTAPRDSVHGVSVQRITGGVDRVMPVLDQNEWSQ